MGITDLKIDCLVENRFCVYLSELVKNSISKLLKTVLEVVLQYLRQ